MSMTRPLKWLLASLLTLTAACGSIGTAAPKPRHAEGSLDLRTPFTAEWRSPYAERHGSAGQFFRHSAQERPNIDAYLKPEFVAKALPTPRLKTEPARLTRPARPADLAPVLAVIAPQVNSSVPEQQASLATSAPPRVSTDAERYALREGQAKKQQDFRGGSVIVISASVVVVALVVVLLLLLILR